jgi:trimeric autotransporter adhesin
MSTKTLRKRIALVAVSALGFGLLSVMPAKAAEADANETTAVALTSDAANTLMVGQVQTLALALDPTATDDDDAYTLKVAFSSVPAGSTAPNLTATAVDGFAGDGATAVTAGTSPGAMPTVVATLTADAGLANGASAKHADVTFTPTTPGNYSVQAWHDLNGDNAIGGSEVSGTLTVVITTNGVGTLEATNSAAAASDTVGSDVEISALAVAFGATPRVGGEASVSATATFMNNRSTAGNINFATSKRVATVKYSLTKPAGSAAALSSASQLILSDNNTNAALGVSDDTTGSALTFTPDVAGTYTVTAYHDADRDGIVDNGEVTATKAIAVFADAPVITIKAFNTTADIGDNEAGALLRIEISNGGAVAALNAGESIKVSVSGGRVDEVNAATNVDNATYSLSSSDFNAKGYAWLNITASAAGTVVASVEGVGGSVAGILKTQSLTFKDATGTADAAITVGNTTGVKSNTAHALETTTGGDNNDTNGAWDVDLNKSTSASLKSSASAASAVVRVLVTDVSGRITGLANNDYATYATASDGTADTNAYNFSFAAPSFGKGANIDTASTNTYSVQFGGSNDVVVVRGMAAADSTVTLDQTDAIRAKNGSAITLSGVVKDQFGVVIPNVAVTITHTAGDRNGQVVATNAVTDASGRVSKTWTDAPLTGVTATTDSVKFDIPNGTDKTATITYVESVGVTKVVAYGGNTSSTGVTAALPTFNDIKAGGGAVTGGEGVETGAVTLSAKVTDASGSVLVGVPVTFSVAGTGVEIATNKVTVYTDTTGVATSSIYGWIKGTYTYTATSEAISSTGTVSFAQTAAGEERTISATVSGSLVTAKVVDRIGNPVPLVKVWATKTGAGYFGNGLNKTDGTTDTNGEITFTIAGAGADVTVATYDMSDATAKGSGQTCALAGNVDCSATAPVAFDASVTGTTLKGSTGVGAAFAPAGVSSAKVTVVADTTTADAATAAADAAAEATDAANAATDAANAAAEAADAATAAAQDAADAVAALSTQVSEMVNALKKQITALTNLVIKIQKKVKA